MASQGKSKFVLLDKFQDFYTEIISLKQQASVGVLSVAVAAGNGGGASTQVSSDQTAVEIWNTVAQYLDREMVQVARSGTSMMTDAYRELVYVMAAVADEVFVHLQWEGQQYWLDHLLEVRFFRSRIAGERIFRNIHAVLLRQDQAAEELAAIYLTVLALGFRGQYWGGDTSDIGRCRLDLLQYLARANPRLIADSKRFFPEAYRYTVQEGVAAQLPSPATWWYVAAGVVVAWLIISTILWFTLTRGIRELQKQNSATITQSPTVPSPGAFSSPLNQRTQLDEHETRPIQVSQSHRIQPVSSVFEGGGLLDLSRNTRGSGNVQAAGVTAPH
jgi:type VI secretion system protein ImpK